MTLPPPVHLSKRHSMSWEIERVRPDFADLPVK